MEKITLEDIKALVEVEKKTKELDEQKQKEALEKQNYPFEFCKRFDVARELNINSLQVTNDIMFRLDYDYGWSNHLWVKQNYGINKNGNLCYCRATVTNIPTEKVLEIKEYSHKMDKIICEALDKEIKKKWQERLQAVSDLANKEYN